jgi:predicted amidohydrolase YtcJ
MLFQADLVIKNSNIRTMNKTNPVASALAVRGDTIIGVGNFDDFATIIGSDTEILDLSGKTVLPGFNDNHGHPLLGASSLAKVNLTDIKTHEELFARLRTRADETPAGEWVEAFGYDESRFAEGRHPSLEEMDAALPNHPLCIARVCMHVGLANSRALKLRGFELDTPNPVGGEIVRENGKLTGQLNETAFAALKEIIPPPNPDRVAKAMAQLCGIYNSFGITSVTEMGSFEDGKTNFAVLDRAVKNNGLTVRMAAYLLEPMYKAFRESGIGLPLGNDLFKFQGRKIILDGSGGAGTARMSIPSKFDGNTGIVYHEQEELDEIVWEAHSQGRQVSCHAIGDIAITMILDAYKKAQERLPRQDARHRIEHCTFCWPKLAERVIKEGVLPLMNPGFLYYFGDTLTRNYGEEAIAQAFPFRSLLDSGIAVGNGSDFPVAAINPRPIFVAAVTRKTATGASCGKEEGITAQEAIYSYTAAGAYLTFDEDKKGTLEIGKLADIVVTDFDPTTVDDEPEKLLEMKVERTILGGKTVYQQG